MKNRAVWQKGILELYRLHDEARRWRFGGKYIKAGREYGGKKREWMVEGQTNEFGLINELVGTFA